MAVGEDDKTPTYSTKEVIMVRPRKVTPEMEKEIIKLRKQGLSLRKIAQKFDIAISTVRRVVDPEVRELEYRWYRRYMKRKRRRQRLLKAWKQFLDRDDWTLRDDEVLAKIVSEGIEILTGEDGKQVLRELLKRGKTITSLVLRI